MGISADLSIEAGQTNGTAFDLCKIFDSEQLVQGLWWRLFWNVQDDGVHVVHEENILSVELLAGEVDDGREGLGNIGSKCANVEKGGIDKTNGGLNTESLETKHVECTLVRSNVAVGIKEYTS